jgi:hypothetical protein
MSKRAALAVRLLIAFLTLATAAVVTGCGGSGGDAGPPRRIATQEGYEAIKGDLEQQRVDIEFLLLHARLHTAADLADELARLAGTSAEHAAALAALDPPSSIAELVAVLQRAVDTQTRSLRAVARAARTDGPPAARTATPRLMTQSERILQARRRLETSFVIGS